MSSKVKAEAKDYYHQADPQYKLRWPAELRDKVAASAKENNRSMNADIVARLEGSFEQVDQDPLGCINDPFVKIYFTGLELTRCDAKMQALRFTIRSLEDKDDPLKEKLKYLLDYTEFEKDGLIVELSRDIEKSGFSLDSIHDANIKNKISNGLANLAQDMTALSFEEMQEKYPSWGAWGSPEK